MKPSTCDNALSAMPGDVIVFDNGQCLDTETVRTSGWQPAPKGGRVWTYETVNSVMVPHTAVVEVRKSQTVSREIEGSISEDQVLAHREAALDLQGFLGLVDKLELSPALKTAIHCLINGSIKNLEVAAFLVEMRVKQLKELQAQGYRDQI